MSLFCLSTSAFFASRSATARSYSRAFSILSAVALFLNWLRSFWHCTTILVGRCVIRTAEDVLLTCCPPFPEARYTSIRRSSSLISISMSSSTTGYTNTDAKDVWRRDCASNGEMRTRRWTPFSAFSSPKAYCPLIWISADLMPASSPWSRSSTSTLKPCRSAHRVYIRISISAQSWDSVPPAPEWMVSSASRVSSEPRSMFCSSRASSCAAIPSASCSRDRPLSISATRRACSSSDSPTASSSSARASSMRLRTAWYGSTQRFSSLISCTACRDFSGSAQTLPSAMACSRSAKRLVFPAMSKKAPQFGETTGEFGTALLHVFPPALLDLVLEELRQRAVAQSLLTLLRMIHDEIRHQRPRQPARLLLRILDHEGIHGPERARHPLTGPSARGRGWSGRRRRRRGGARCRGRRSARRRCGRRCSGSHGRGCRRRGGAWGGRRRGAGRGGGGCGGRGRRGGGRDGAREPGHGRRPRGRRRGGSGRRRGRGRWRGRRTPRSDRGAAPRGHSRRGRGYGCIHGKHVATHPTAGAHAPGRDLGRVHAIHRLARWTGDVHLTYPVVIQLRVVPAVDHEHRPRLRFRVALHLRRQLAHLRRVREAAVLGGDEPPRQGHH